MPSLVASIPTRSERQAMDWSLVLASQGIDAVIDRNPQADTWQLLVPDPEYSRALRAIREYLKENKTRRWHQELPFTDLILDWRGVVPMLFFILLYASEATGRGSLRTAGMAQGQAILSGEWWRLFTAVTLHADLSHLAANVTTGLLLVGLAMGAYGAGWGLLVPYLAGVAGNLAGLFIYPPHHQSLGASGMILGALGLLAAHSFVLFRRGLAPRFLAVRGILSACLLLVLLGFSPQENVDLVAHVGGFLAGLGLGGLLAWARPAFTQAPAAHRLALTATALLVAVPWWFAVRAGHL